jgi:thiol-disulfide isomerase/thioredoxin
MVSARRVVVLGCLLCSGIGVLAGCGEVRAKHPAVGRRVGRLPIVSLADPARPPPSLAGRVTLLNFWGTWCPPCRRELPGLVRLAGRLSDEPGFQLVAISCGNGGPDDLEELSMETRQFLAAATLSLDAWGDPDGFTRTTFGTAYGFTAFPTTYLIGPDATIVRVWTGYRPADEAEIAAAVIKLLRSLPPRAPGGPAPEMGPVAPAG